MTSVVEIITSKLSDALSPVTSIEVTIIDASTGKFGVAVVSPAFKGMSLIQRHRKVNDALKEELLAGTVHALTISASAPPSD